MRRLRDETGLHRSTHAIGLLSIICTILLLAYLAFLAATAEGATRTCPDVTFTPRSDFVADKVVATNYSCRYARGVVVTVVRRGYAPYGFDCTYWSHDYQLAHDHFRCERGDAVVTWTQY